MYKLKKEVKDIFVDRELRALSTIVSPEELDVIRFFKHKYELREKWQDRG